ncbi:MAG TPA: amidohydrolase family protein [Verrucomicrobiae bacterium]|nr:amidohydrolase family protein [Verrucomicrobiae bacterium]
MRIDSHQHFWRYNSTEYEWIGDDKKPIQRDFLPEHLLAEIAAVKLDGVISVQARQTREETQWLLDLATRYHFIKGVVGWADLVSTRIDSELEIIAAHPKLKAIRHVVQCEPEGFLLRADFNRGIRELRKYDLVYDILIFSRHLPNAITLVDAHPNQIFVLNHLAKPSIAKSDFELWDKHLRDLAKRPNVYCKVSGMVTEGDFGDQAEIQLRSFFDVAAEAFGPKRLLFGSDWPVCLLACSYPRWHGIVSNWVDGFTSTEKSRIFGETATEVYRL